MKQKLLLLLLFVNSVVAGFAQAPDFQGAFVVDGIKYIVIDDGAVVVGLEKSFTSLKIPTSVKNDGNKYKVTQIGMLGAMGVNLTNIELPKTVTNISAGCFSGCKNLKAITIPASVKEIASGTFQSCSNLQNVVLNEGLEKIGSGAFENCTSLVGINLPSTLKSIGFNAFRGCTALQSVEIPKNVEELGMSAFDNCINLSSFRLNSSSITEIPGGFFNNCKSLTTITLTEFIRNIGAGAFTGCTALREVSFYPRSNVKKIDSNAFFGCSNLTKVGDLVFFELEQLGVNAFWGCSKLYPEHGFISFNKLDSIQPGTFTDCKALKTVSLESVSYVGENAFHGCTSLESVHFDENKIKYIGNYAFFNCSHLNNAFGLNAKINFGNGVDGVFSGTFVDTNPIRLSYKFYASNKIADAIAAWQQKKKYETTVQWKKRVTPETRLKKYEELKDSVRTAYINQFRPKILKCKIESYDADQGVFKLKTENLNTYNFFNNNKDYLPIEERNEIRHAGEQRYIYAKVPQREAEAFENQFDKVKIIPTYCITKDYLDVASCTFALNGKKYVSPVLYDDETANLDVELPPLDFELLDSAQPDMAAVTDRTIDENIPSTNAESPNTFVVIVGNENYKNVARVPYALNDAKVFKEYCMKTLGVPENNIRSYPDATYAMMLSALKDIQDISASFKGNINVVFYYAGHGVPDEKDRTTYLLPVDADGSQTEVCMPVSKLYDGLASMKAQSVVVFMDACFSGARRGEGMLASARGVAIKPREAAPQGKMVIFSAASGDETAYPYKEKGHGMFTYFLLKKIRDTKGDATLGDLGQYIIDNVKQQSVVVNRKSQTPMVIAADSWGDEWKTLKLK